MYLLTLLAHSMILRWLVLLSVLIRAGTAGYGLVSGSAWTPLERRISLVAMIFADTQVLLGLLLYLVLSPTVHQAFSDPGAAMGNAHLRFYLVEHPTLMIVAVALLHVGNVLAKRAADDRRRFQVTAITATLAFVCLLLGVYAPH